MPILRFMFATLITALCLDSVVIHAEVLSSHPDIFGWMIVMFCTKLVAAAVIVALALWCRSAWRAWT